MSSRHADDHPDPTSTTRAGPEVAQQGVQGQRVGVAVGVVHEPVPLTVGPVVAEGVGAVERRQRLEQLPLLLDPQVHAGDVVGGARRRRR